MEDVKINNLTSKLSDETRKYLEKNEDVAREVYNVLNGIADKAGRFKTIDNSLLEEVQGIAQLLGADQAVGNAAKKIDDIITSSRNNVSGRYAQDVERQLRVKESIKKAVSEMGDAIRSKLDELDTLVKENFKLKQSKAQALEKALLYASGLEDQVADANKQKDAALKRALHFGAEAKRTGEELEALEAEFQKTSERKNKSLKKALFYNAEFNRVSEELTKTNKAVAEAQEEINTLRQREADLKKQRGTAVGKALELNKRMREAESKLANANRLRSIATQKALAYSKKVKELSTDNDNYSKSLTAYEKAVGTFFNSEETLKLIGAQNLAKLKKEFTVSISKEKASAKTISEQIRQINNNYKNEIIRRAIYSNFDVALFKENGRERGEDARDDLEKVIRQIEKKDLHAAVKAAGDNKLKKAARKEYISEYMLTQGMYANAISNIMAEVGKIVPVTKEDVDNVIQAQKDEAGFAKDLNKIYRHSPKRVIAIALTTLILIGAGAGAAAHYIPKYINERDTNNTLSGVIIEKEDEIAEKDEIIADKDNQHKYDINLTDYTGKIRHGVDTLLYTQDSANAFANNNTVAQTSASGKIVAYAMVKDIEGVDQYLNTINNQVDKAAEIAVFNANDELVGGKFVDTLKAYQAAVEAKDYDTVNAQLNIVKGYVSEISGNEYSENIGEDGKSEFNVTEASYVTTARNAYTALQDYITKQYKEMLDVINTPSYSFDFTAEDILAYKSELNDGFTGNVKNVLNCNYDRQSGNVTILAQIAKDKFGKKTSLAQISYTIDAGRASVTLNDIMTLPRTNETRTEYAQNMSGLTAGNTVSMAIDGNIVVGNAQISYNFSPKIERVGDSWQATYTGKAIAVMSGEDGSVIGVRPIEIKSTSINKYSAKEFSEADVAAKLQAKFEQQIRTQLNVSEVEQNVETEDENV